MPLTSAQQIIVKADILANGDLNSKPNTADGAFAIADLYALTAVPDYWVYKTSLGKHDLTDKVSPDGTSFTWAGNGFISRASGEIAAWIELFNSSLTCNPSLPNVRQAFQDIFSGAGNAAANRTHLLAMARRKANRLEKLLATGTGTTVSPATMTFEGLVSYVDIQAARNS